MYRRHLPYDSLLDLKDAGAVASSAAGQVSSADRILDLGAGRVDATAVIEVSAIEIDCDLAAQGTLSLPTQPSNGNTMTIGTKVYTFDTNGALQNIDGHIEIGASLGATQTNIVNAINRTGVPGTGYAAAMTIHPSVSSAAFAANNAVLTAKVKGAAGNSIATTETFTPVGDVFDGVTLGTTQAGRDNDELYEICLQGSNSATFASGIADLASVHLGAAEVNNEVEDTALGRFLLEFTNDFAGTVYRYLRVYADLRDGNHDRDRLHGPHHQAPVSTL